MENIKKQRIVFPDMLKIIAALMVIMIHTASNFDKGQYAVRGGEFFTSVFLDGISRAGVPLFIMISGMFLLDENKVISIKLIFKKYILRILMLYIFWDFFYSFFYQIILSKQWNWNGVNSMLKSIAVGQYHMWYLVMLIGIYLVTPILKTFIYKNNMKVIRYFLVLSMIFQFLLPTLIYFLSYWKNMEILNNIYNLLNLNIVLGYVPYYILGWYLYSKDYTIKQVLAIMITGLCAVFIIVFGTVEISWHKNQADQTLFGYLNIFVAIYSCSIFVGVKFIFEKYLKACNVEKIIHRLGQLSLGVYLIHALFLERITSIYQYNDTKNIMLYIISVWLVTSIFSYVASWLISKCTVITKLVES